MEKNCRGQLKNWKDGFGFVRYEGRDVFVHRSAYLPGFETEIGQVGQILAFDFVEAPNGKPPMAGNVRVITSAGADAKARVAEAEIMRAVETLRKLLASKQGGAI